MRTETAYRVECDAHWHVTHAVLKVMGGGTLELRGDGAGHWRDGSGRALPELDGCIDIDIAATPFTNSLPIGRLGSRAVSGGRSTSRTSRRRT